MTSPKDMTEQGFEYTFQDRTMKMKRTAKGMFRAPFTMMYNGEFQSSSRPFFNLTSVMIPTTPGHSRIIIYGSPVRRKGKKKKRPKSLFALVFAILPTWLLHQVCWTP